MAISDTLKKVNPSQHPKIKAKAHLAAVPLGTAGVPDPVTRNGITVIFDAPPKLISKDDGTVIGVDAMIRAFKGGQELVIDPHRRFINPPVLVPDGGTEQVTVTFGGKDKVIERSTFKEDPWEAYLQILFDSIQTAPAPEGFRTQGTVDTIYGIAGDGWIRSDGNPNYSDARAGTGYQIAAYTIYDAIEVGQAYAGGTYTCNEGFFGFDTSGIGTDTVSSATLSLYLTNDTWSQDEFTNQVRVKSWSSGGLTTADFVAGASLTGLTLVAHKSSSGIGAAGYKDFVDDALAANINGSGNTEFIIHSDRQSGNTAPTQQEIEDWNDADYTGTTRDPKLVVTHAAAPVSSVSPSVSPSKSPSSSPSQSPSASVSPSKSPSSSPSQSPSASVSPSPSPGWSNYTRGNYVTLPTDDTYLENTYSAQDEIDVSTSNDVRVAQTGLQQFMVHQYKDYFGATSCSLTWEGQTTLEPSASTVYLQIYNRNTTTWNTVDSDNTSAVNTDFILTANIADLTNYKDGSGVISCRIYQNAL